MNIGARSMWTLFGAVALGGAALWWGVRPLRVPQAERRPAAPARAAGPEARPVRFVMSAAFVSDSGISVYEDIARYLAQKTGLKTEFVTGLAYTTINDMLESGAVDCGFICGLPYVILHDRPEPAAYFIAAPVMKSERYEGQPKYYSDLIVRRDSVYKSIQDLKGRTYVYNDDISNSGYNMPRYRMVQLGLTGGFFGKVVRSGSHEESIRMVAAGEADASFVDSLVLDYDRENGTGHAHEVRVLESVGPAGICPLVSSARLPEPTRATIQRELVGMHEDPEGKKILDSALLAKFVVVEDSNYDDVRAMRAAAEKAGYTVIK